MGFHRSQRESSFGLHFTCTSTRRGTRSTAGSGAGTRKRLRIPGKLEPSGPEGGRAEGRGAARKPKGSRREGCRAAGDPSADPTPGPRLGREGAASEKEVELTPRSSSERKSGPSSRPSCGVGGARHAGGEDGVGETQSETLVPGRRGPHARPQPAVPTARPGIGAAGEHPPSWLLRSEDQRRRAPHRGPEGLAAAGRGLGAAPPLPGAGAGVRESASRRPASRLKVEAAKTEDPKGRPTWLATASGWLAPTPEGLKVARGAVQFLLPEGCREKPSKCAPGSTVNYLIFVLCLTIINRN